MDLGNDQTIRVFDLSVQADDIARLLVTNDFKLTHLVRKTHNLEEVFLKMIQAKGMELKDD